MLLNSLTIPVAKEKIEWTFIGFGFISSFLFFILRNRIEAHFDMNCSCELWLWAVTPIAKTNEGRSWQSNGSKNEQHIQFYAFGHKRGARAKTTSFHRVLKSKMNSTQFNEHEHTRPLVARAHATQFLYFLLRLKNIRHKNCCQRKCNWFLLPTTALKTVVVRSD